MVGNPFLSYQTECRNSLSRIRKQNIPMLFYFRRGSYWGLLVVQFLGEVYFFGGGVDAILDLHRVSDTILSLDIFCVKFLSSTVSGIY